MDLANMFAQLPTLMEAHPRLQWYYTPYTNDATLLLRDATNEDISGCWDKPKSKRYIYICIMWWYYALFLNLDSILMSQNTPNIYELFAIQPIQCDIVCGCQLQDICRQSQIIPCARAIHRDGDVYSSGKCYECDKRLSSVYAKCVAAT